MGVQGRRLPKCLLEVGGRTLLDHQLDLLAGVGIRCPWVVVGHHADLVAAALGNRGRTITNARYRETNNLWSFWLAREVVRGTVIVFNGDLLICEAILQRLLAAGPDYLVIDSGSRLTDEATKVELVGGRVVRAEKGLAATVSHAESIGLLLLSAKTSRDVFDVGGRVLATDGSAFLPSVLGSCAGRVAVRALDVAGLPWIEIDTPEEFDRARTSVWPRIKAGAQRVDEERRAFGRRD
jgi:choline kinase